MKLRIPPHVSRLAPYKPGKPIEEVERELGLGGTIKLASNENPLGPSPLAVRAATEALAESNRYPDGGGYYLKEALARKLDLGEERIVLGNGSTELVELIARTFLGPGTEAVISEGAFVMYRIASQAVGAESRLVPQTSDLRHDSREIAASVGGRTRVVFIANPNNPTGTYITDRELADLLSAVPPDVLVVVDEAYYEYVVAEDYPATLPKLAVHPNLIILRTFSKAYGLAGLRIGYALVSSPVAEALERVRSPFNTSHVAQRAALAALADEEHVVRSRETNLAELPVLAEGLRRIGIEPVPSVANFLLAPVGPRAERVYSDLLRLGVIARPMGFFGFPHALRITVGTPGENRRCLDALGRVLGG